MSGPGKWLSAWCVWVLLIATEALAGPVILVRSQLTGEAAAISNRAIQSFRQTFVGELRETENTRELSRYLESEQPSLVVAVGNRAADMVRDVRRNVPLLCMLVYEPTRFGQLGDSLGAISFEVPGAAQLTHFKELLPNLKVIGAIYSRSQHDTIEEARRAAAQLGIEILAVPAESANEVETGLALIGNRQVVDAIWILVDPSFVARVAWPDLVRDARTRGLPVLVPLEATLPAGVLAAPVLDATEVGRQGAEIASAVAQGRLRMRDVGLRPPRSELVVRRASASQLGIALPRNPGRSIRFE